MRTSSWFLTILLLAFSTATSAVTQFCGSLENAYGPFDYRTRKDKLKIVEQFHFNADVEQLVKGMTGKLGGDIDYVLRAFPNHARALMSMSNLVIRSGTEQALGAHFTINCYFDRALRFAPDDGVVYMIYGTYLYRKGKLPEARAALENAQKFAGDNANLHYNMGLLYFDLKEYDLSREHAQKAYAMGFALPGLRAKLEKANKW